MATNNFNLFNHNYNHHICICIQLVSLKYYTWNYKCYYHNVIAFRLVDKHFSSVSKCPQNVKTNANCQHYCCGCKQI